MIVLLLSTVSRWHSQLWGFGTDVRSYKERRTQRHEIIYQLYSMAPEQQAEALPIFLDRLFEVRNAVLTFRSDELTITATSYIHIT